jgi:predicted  nucleic acid-binding Zn-ribbon protein
MDNLEKKWYQRSVDALSNENQQLKEQLGAVEERAKLVELKGNGYQNMQRMYNTLQQKYDTLLAAHNQLQQAYVHSAEQNKEQAKLTTHLESQLGLALRVLERETNRCTSDN